MPFKLAASMTTHRARSALILMALLAGCATQPGNRAPAQSQAAAKPDATEMAVAANPLASAAGLAMLKRGGAPVDAAVAMQAVLGLVEPQASGLGGGSVLLTWQAAEARLAVYDGTPRAGRNAAAGLNADEHGRPLDPASVMHGGSAVGVPGTLPALWLAHRAQGKLPWAELFAPAIKLADDGFPMPHALHSLLAAPGAAESYAGVAWMYEADGRTVPPDGAKLRNPAYAATLRRVARLGPPGLYADGMTQEVLAALDRGAQPSRLTAADLRDAAATEQTPLCAPWLGWRICTAPPPSYGGLLALQTLIMAGPGDLSNAAYAHRFLDAGRLAQTDRRRYVGDPDQVQVPDHGLLDPQYLAARAAQISPDRAIAHPKPGEPPEPSAAARPDPGAPTTATSQIAVVDRAGNALTMTTSLTHAFGARVTAGGVVFNNALVNFAPMPPSGVRYVNGMAPGKRPATPMAPVMAFDASGRLALLGGSGGGPGVPDFVAAGLLDLLSNHRSPAEAVARPHVSAAEPDHVTVEAGTDAERLLPALQAMDHQAQADPLPSSSAFIARTATGWAGAADPRRDGVALGD